MEHDIKYLKIELSQKWQKYDLVRFYSIRLNFEQQYNFTEDATSIVVSRVTLKQTHIMLIS